MSDIQFPDISHLVLDNQIERLKKCLHQYLDYQLSVSRHTDQLPLDFQQTISAYQDLLETVFDDVRSQSELSIAQRIREMKLLGTRK